MNICSSISNLGKSIFVVYSLHYRRITNLLETVILFLPGELLNFVDCLKPEINKQNRIIIIDEVGRLELYNKGWSDSVAELLKASCNHLIMAVRTDQVKSVIEKWQLDQAIIINISNTTISSSITLITDKINMK